MQKFYKQISTDMKTMTFYMECAACGERKHADRLPLLCISQQELDALEKGKAGGIRQKVYNHKKALAVQHLARFYNQCRNCKKWVCDACYHMDIDEGICKDCTAARTDSL